MPLLPEWLGFDTCELVSPLPRTRCAEILRREIQQDGLGLRVGTIVGRVEETSCRIYLSRNLIVSLERESITPVLYAEFLDHDGGTRLICRTAPSYRPTAWLALGVGLAGPVLVAVLHAIFPQHPLGNMTLAFILALFGLGGAAYLCFGRSVRSNRLLHFISRTLDAKLRR